MKRAPKLTKASRASDLRKAFDRSFAEPPPPESEETADYLGIRIGSAPYAVALSEIGAVFADRKIAPLPSGASELLGVAGVRGDIVPVFALSAMLGQSGASERPRWLVLAAGGRAGFAFDALDGHLRIPRASITPASSGSFVAANAVIGKDARPIVSVPALMDHLERRAGHSAAKEQ